MKLLKLIGALAVAVFVAAGSTVALLDDTSPQQEQDVLFGAGEFEIRLVRESPTRVTFNWTPQTGYGYLFSRDDVLVGRSSDPNRFWATFFRGADEYEVGVQDKGVTGTYPPLAGTLTMSVLSETANTITFGWTPQAGYGYLFSGDGTVVSRTYNAGRSYAKFAKDYTTYEVAVIVKGDTGIYPPIAAGTAHFWVDSNGGSCTRQNPADGYDNDGTECATVAAAVSAASASDTVLIMASNYPGQSISSPPNGMTIGVADGQTVTFDKLTISNTVNLTVNGPLTLDGDYHHLPLPSPGDWSMQVQNCHTNLTLNDISGYTFDFGVSIDGATISGGSWGNYTDRPYGGDPTIGGATAGCGGPGKVTGLLIDGVHFHDVQFGLSDTWQDAHPDCLQIEGGVDGVTIRDSIFERCGNTFIGTFLDIGDMDNLLIENNVFVNVADTSFGFQIGWKLTNQCDVVFRYNTYDPNYKDGVTGAPPLINCEGDGTPNDTIVYGNIFKTAPSGGCDGTWSYNVFENGTPCGTNYQTGDVAFVDQPVYPNQALGDWDFHLPAGSLALDKGQPGTAPTNFPSVDFEGTSRTSPPDAGYDER